MGLLILLHYLHAPCSFGLLGELFGVAGSTAFKLLMKTAKSIVAHLRPVYVRWPDTTATATAAQCWQDICGIPNILAAVDGFHAPLMNKPAQYFPEQWYSRYKRYTVAFLAFCGPDYVVYDFVPGVPGSQNDISMLKYHWQGWDQLDKIVPPPYVILGDSGFPTAHRALITPHSQTPCTSFVL